MPARHFYDDESGERGLSGWCTGRESARKSQTNFGYVQQTDRKPRGKIMANDAQYEIVKQGTQAWREWRTQNPGRMVDLSGANLAYLELVGIDLSGVILANAILTGANLTGADLTGANLISANLYQTYLIGANLNRALLMGANLTGANLRGANLADANLSGAVISYTTMPDGSVRAS